MATLKYQPIHQVQKIKDGITQIEMHNTGLNEQETQDESFKIILYNKTIE